MQIIILVYHCIADELEDNIILEYTDFSFDEFTEEEMLRVQLEFPLVKFFPKYFLYVLINHGMDAFLDIFRNDEYDTPKLIWNKNMREQLLNFLRFRRKNSLL